MCDPSPWSSSRAAPRSLDRKIGGHRARARHPRLKTEATSESRSLDRKIGVHRARARHPRLTTEATSESRSLDREIGGHCLRSRSLDRKIGVHCLSHPAQLDKRESISRMYLERLGIAWGSPEPSFLEMATVQRK